MQSAQEKGGVDEECDGHVPRQLLVGVDVDALEQADAASGTVPALVVVDDGDEQQGQGGHEGDLALGLRCLVEGLAGLLQELDVGVDEAQADDEDEAEQH